MAKVEFTDAQRAVIDARNANLLVSAAAGSGKTAVLTARILSLLTDPEHPIDIDRMLIVTFTKAAAAEMRERIGKAIAEYVAEHPEDLRMDRQAALLHNAQITTIDSFCLYVVRNNFADIDLDPGFRILDTGERTLMMQDVMEEMLEDEYAAAEEDFIHLMESYAPGGRESEVISMIQRLFDFAMSLPQPEAWIRKAMKDAAVTDLAEASAEPWFARLTKSADEMIAQMQKTAEETLAMVQAPDGPEAYLGAVSDYRLLAERLSDNAGYERRKEILSAFEIPKLSSKKGKTEDPAVRELAKQRIDRIKELIGKLREQYSLSAEQYAAAQQEIAVNTAALCRLALAFAERFAAAKREKNALDFTDMEHFALQILWEEKDGKQIPSRAAEEFRDYFEYICVDEYQDSNYVQESVLTSIVREDNYFMVGDVKQSIYRFRLARPEIFLQKYDRFGEDGINRRIDLNQNFRSRTEVLDFVNAIFRQIMQKDTAEMDYDERAALHLGAKYYPQDDTGRCRAELLILDPREELEDPETEEEEADLAEDAERKPTKRELESRLAADRIHRLVRDGFPVWDGEQKALRPIRYSDIVILVRSTKDYEKAMRQVCAEYDIPLHCGAQAGYFETLEVRMTLSALQVIDNPQQDQPLYACLTSFLKLFTEEEIAMLRAKEKQGSLYHLLRSYPERDHTDPGICGKLQQFFDWLGRYRALAKYRRVRELLEMLLAESGYLDHVSALPGGAQRRANLELLLERASEYESGSYQGLFHFVRYVSQLKSREVDFGEAGMLDESADVVRMMTIHKSKGLEFPVCICMGLYKKFNFRDASATMLLDSDLGIGLDAVDPVRRCRIRGIKRSVLSQKSREDALAEEMRILYVALTRAKEKLILTDVRETQEGEDEEAPDTFTIKKASNAMQLIRMALAAEGQLIGYVRIMHPEDLKQQIVKEAAEAAVDEQLLRSRRYGMNLVLWQKLKEEAERVYSHPELKGLYTKTSVSELKHAAFDEEEARRVFETERREAYIPDFARAEDGEESSGTSRGSAYHRFLELLPYETMPEQNRGSDPAAQESAPLRGWLERSLQQMRDSGRLSQEYAGLIRLPAMEKFLRQDIAGRMRKAAGEGKLFREQPFFMGVKANELEASYPATEQIIIQGVIDVYLEEEDGLVLLDYKTDRVSAGEELVARYQKQLELYARALTQIRGIPVKERLIYSFALDRTIAI
ncbi:MAG: helicase-exonuclease AddAB subunit AddA [Lachnospiraceae bacterium]|nr:helicase-exonuclease AddAB subunit AddA [Lachnospiraceae bacterium]